MKKVLIAISALLIAAAAQGQGIVQFNNRIVGTVDAPITIEGKSATSYTTVAQVAAAYGSYKVGLVDATSGAVYGVTTFRTTALNRAGYVNAVDIDIGSGAKSLRVAAWTGSADAAGYAAAKTSGAFFGESAAITVTGGVPPATGNPLMGLTSFNVAGAGVVTPEPATLALAALGGLALVIRRRK